MPGLLHPERALPPEAAAPLECGELLQLSLESPAFACRRGDHASTLLLKTSHA
jgi:hypothetical protein